MLSALKANISYLVKLRDIPFDKKIPVIEYKLVRKELYVSIANLSAAFHRMLSEPKSKQQDSKKVYRFVVLNNVLSSNVASLSSGINDMTSGSWPKENLQQLQRSIKMLEGTLQKLDAAYQSINTENTIATTDQPADKHLTEQLDFIYKVSAEIEKISEEIK